MPSSPLPLFLVDAFADRPFAGNAAAVCLLDAPADPGWMAAVAGELQQAATAFVYEQGEGFGLRWFVPGRELQLCGHGTLAAAHVLWEAGQLWPDAPAQFQTASGLLSARRDADAIALDFPAEPVQPLDPPDGLLEALGVEARALARGTFDLLVEVESEAAVRAIQPDFSRLRQIDARGIIVTAAADGQQTLSQPTMGHAPNGQPVDFVSRFFAPRVGIDEDAVTGSAHCLLGPYWQRKLGRDALVGYQASARGGTVRVQVNGPRVTLCGRAITVMSGSLVPPPAD
ncbi:MAG: PhzF family phenazine biosynthesis protein [Chloroflexi bacterium]|nr:PhzF family phenazine biosynthesis protein [Chloroflexota bacterium]